MAVGLAPLKTNIRTTTISVTPSAYLRAGHVLFAHRVALTWKSLEKRLGEVLVLFYSKYHQSPWSKLAHLQPRDPHTTRSSWKQSPWNGIKKKYNFGFIFSSAWGHLTSTCVPNRGLKDQHKGDILPPPVLKVSGHGGFFWQFH